MSAIRKEPRLRTVEKSEAAYPLNKFPKGFAEKLAQHLIYTIATKGANDLAGKFKCELLGSDFERIFADCIKGEWKPSNVGLDDILLGNTAWGAKTVIAKDPMGVEKVRLISGRNSPQFSFQETVGPKTDPDHVGEQVLSIWNERVSAIRMKYKHLRTVVLMKSEDLSRVGIFEFDTNRMDPELYSCMWNKNKNLEGRLKSNGEHRFTWQPHGGQFTIVEDVPQHALFLEVKRPKVLPLKFVLDEVGYDKTWFKSLTRK